MSDGEFELSKEHPQSDPLMMILVLYQLIYYMTGEAPKLMTKNNASKSK